MSVWSKSIDLSPSVCPEPNVSRMICESPDYALFAHTISFVGVDDAKSGIKVDFATASWAFRASTKPEKEAVPKRQRED